MDSTTKLHELRSSGAATLLYNLRNDMRVGRLDEEVVTYAFMAAFLAIGGSQYDSRAYATAFIQGKFNL